MLLLDYYDSCSFQLSNTSLPLDLDPHHAHLDDSQNHNHDDRDDRHPHPERSFSWESLYSRTSDMFLHAGAGLHGHEYSHRQTPPIAAGPRRILRSALANNHNQHHQNLTPRSTTPLSHISSSTGASELKTGATRTSTTPIPSTPQRRLSFDGSSPASSTTATPPARSSTPSRRPRPTSELISGARRDLHMVRFEPPRMSLDSTVERARSPASHRTSALSEPPSEDEGSFSYSDAENSDASGGTTIVRRRKRTRKTARLATNFLLAQAPPRHGPTKRLLHLRPRLLLQLQQVSAEHRPRPSIDVVPSSLISGTLIASRLARRFPRMLGFKRELGLNDVLLVRSEDYDTDHSSDNDSEEDSSLERRELVAVISPIPRQEDEADMVLGDGSVWRAKPMANGSYEFNHVDAAGNTKTARWVRRSVSKTTPAASGPATVPPTDYTFKFSMINPLSRRHPIMATLAPTSLEILDHYTTISSSSGLYPPSKPVLGEVVAGTSTPDPTQTMAPTSERSTLPVDEATKTLITVSAVWLTLRFTQGWPTTNLRTAHPVGGSHARSSSSSFAGDRTSMVILPPENATPSISVTPAPTTSGSVARVPIGQRQSTAPAATGLVAESSATSTPRRTMSTGAVYMQRRRERMAAEAAATSTVPESEADDAQESGGVELSYGPLGESHGKFYRKLRALRDRLTLRGTRSH